MTSTEILAFATGAIGLLSAVAMGFVAFKKDSSGMKNDIIATYEKRMKQMEEDLESLKNDLQEVKTLLEKSETDRIKAEQILQGRNPELDHYMQLTLQMLTDIHGAVMPQKVKPV